MVKAVGHPRTIRDVEYETISLEESACEWCGEYSSEIFLHATGAGFCDDCVRNAPIGKDDLDDRR